MSTQPSQDLSARLVGITEISRCELLTSPSGEELLSARKTQFSHPTQTEGAERGGGQRKERGSCGHGLGNLDLWEDCRMQDGRGGERVV